jgi:Holliday junction resolvase
MDKKAKTIGRGKGFEYRIRNWFRRAGYEANRVPVSGASPAMKGDVVVKLNDGVMFLECKFRTGGYKELFRWLKESEEKGILGVVVGVGRSKPVVVMGIDKFIELVKKGDK